MKMRVARRRSILLMFLVALLVFSVPGLAFAEAAGAGFPVDTEQQAGDSPDQATSSEAAEPDVAGGNETPSAEGSEVPQIDEGAEPADETGAEPTDEGETSFKPMAGSYDGAVVTLGFFNAPTQHIDIPGQSTTPGVQATLFEANSSPAQRFRLKLEADGFYSIINVRSGLALDVSGATARNGAQIVQWAYHGGANQRWGLASNANGSVTLVSKLDTTFCIDAAAGSSANSTPLLLWKRGTNQPNQSFALTRISPVVANGTYTVRAASGSTVLDVSGASQTPGTRVLTFQSNGGYHQRFTFTYDPSTGYYTIAAVHSGMLLDVEGSGWSPGTKVVQWPGTGAFNQKWSIEQNGSSGSFTICSASNAMSLDISGSNASNGADLIVWPLHGKANQQWVLAPTAVLNINTYTISLASGTLLDVSGHGTANGTNIGTWVSNNGMHQRFYLNCIKDDIYTIEDLNSHKYVTVESPTGTNVVLYEWQNSDTQKWRLLPAGNGRYTLQSLSAGGKILSAASTASGANVLVATAGSTATQAWKFTAAAPVNDGLYVFTSALNKSLALDIPGHSSTPGVGLTLYELNSGPAQRFALRKVSGDYYRITSVSSGLVLDITGSSLNATTGAGTVIQFQASTGNALNQMWRIEYVGNGGVRFVSALANERAALNVTSATPGNSTAVGVLDKNGSPAQTFLPTKIANISYDNLSLSLDQMTAIQKAQSGGTVVNNGSGWVTATNAEVYAALDPVQQSDKMMQFVDLRIPTGLTGAQVDAYINSGSDPRSVFRGLGSVFVAAANQYGINEAYFISHAINETGWGKYVCGNNAFEGFYYDGKTKIVGQYYPAGTYYNFWGIGAYDSNALSGGQNYAVSHGWNSPEAAIYGSAKLIADNYIYSGQPTLYSMRWDYSYSSNNGSASGHKYATDINWARTSARLMEQLYNSTGTPELYYIMPSYRPV